ncbi:MAG: hypothetical protein WC897_02895 [Candidatus Gracilibacteria bacterium]
MTDKQGESEKLAGALVLVHPEALYHYLDKCKGQDKATETEEAMRRINARITEVLSRIDKYHRANLPILLVPDINDHQRLQTEGLSCELIPGNDLRSRMQALGETIRTRQIKSLELICAPHMSPADVAHILTQSNPLICSITKNTLSGMR